MDTCSLLTHGVENEMHVEGTGRHIHCFWLESKLSQNSSSHGSIPLLVVKLPGTGGDLQGLLDPLHVEDPVPGCSTACSVHRIIQRMEKVLTTKWLNKLSMNYYIDVLVVPILSNMM